MLPTKAELIERLKARAQLIFLVLLQFSWSQKGYNRGISDKTKWTSGTF